MNNHDHDENEVKNLIVQQGDSLDAFKSSIALRQADLEKQIGRLRAGLGVETAANRGGANPEAKAEFVAFLKTGEMKAMSVGSGPDGGYLVTEATAPQIYRARAAAYPFVELAGHVAIEQADALEVATDGGASLVATFAGETDQRPATPSPTVAVTRIPTHEAYLMPESTQKMLDDNHMNAEQFIIDKLAEGFAGAFGPAYISGNGVTRPRGLITYPVSASVDGARLWGTVQVIPTGASGAFLLNSGVGSADVFVDTVASLRAQYKPNAKWVMSGLTFASVAKLKDADGRPLMQTNPSVGTPASILGYPVVVVEDMPGIAANSLSIAFGDFKKAYLIVDRTGIIMLRDPYTNKPFVRFYSTMRSGGSLLDSNACKFIRFSAT